MLFNIRALIATALVAVGAILVAAGPSGLRRGADLIGTASGYLCLAAAVLLVLARVLPSGAWAGPLLLASMGIVILGFRAHTAWYENRWALVGGLLMVIGGVWVSQPSSKPTPPTTARPKPYVRVVSIGYRLPVSIPAKVPAPQLATLVAVAGRLTLDLSAADAPRRQGIELFVSCWVGGHVTLVVPNDWAVVGGRLHSAYAISSGDSFDLPEVFPEPWAESAATRLEGAAIQHYAAVPEEFRGSRPVWAVVHVTGLGGRLTIERRSTAKSARSLS